MPPIHAIDRLNDLLCLMELRKTARHLANENYARAIVEWAEEAVIAGNHSESLLILASLGLDATPNEDEIRDYLGRYMIEAGLVYPGTKLSTLVWLRIQLEHLIRCETVQDAEGHLRFFVDYWVEANPKLVSKICQHLNWLYFYLFDDGIGYPSTASTMTDAEILAYIRTSVRPCALVLSKEQWLSWLADEPLPNR